MNLSENEIFRRDTIRIGHTCDIGKLPGRKGCLILLFESGRAVVSGRECRMTATKGKMAVLFPETAFMPEAVSGSFLCTYIWVDDRIMEDACNRLTNMAFWDFLYQYPVFPLTSEQKRYFQYWLELTRWYAGEMTGLYGDSLLRNQMVNLFMSIDSELMRSAASGFRPGMSRTFSITGRFLSLLAEKAGEHHDVKYYAGELCITPDYLNKVTRRYYGMSAKGIIDSFLIVEIKSYLLLKNYTVKEIAARLGFEDTSYMCRFFRKKTGKSPTEYRLTPSG